MQRVEGREIQGLSSGAKEVALNIRDKGVVLKPLESGSVWF